MVRVQLSKELDSFEQEFLVTIFLYFYFYKQCWPFIVSIQKIFLETILLKKLQFPTILLPYKKVCYWEENICKQKTCSCPFCTIISYVNLGWCHKILGWKFIMIFLSFLWNLFWGKVRLRKGCMISL